MKACCKNCEYLEVLPDAAGRRVVWKDRTYPCLAPLPPNPVVPDCISEHYAYKAISVSPRRRMEGSEGTLCPIFKARKK